MKKIIITTILALFAVCAQAQTESDKDSIFVRLDSTIVDMSSELQNRSNYEGRIEIEQNKDIEKALAKHREQNLSNQHLNGWRVGIYKGNKQNSRAVSKQVKLNFQSQYADIPSYIKYNSPYFYVFVGDFRTKEDAEKFKHKIKDTYTSAWIKEEKINLPNL